MAAIPPKEFMEKLLEWFFEKGGPITEFDGERPVKDIEEDGDQPIIVEDNK
jgi:hypothetical protein